MLITHGFKIVKNKVKLGIAGKMGEGQFLIAYFFLILKLKIKEKMMLIKIKHIITATTTPK